MNDTSQAIQICELIKHHINERIDQIIDGLNHKKDKDCFWVVYELSLTYSQVKGLADRFNAQDIDIADIAHLSDLLKQLKGE